MVKMYLRYITAALLLLGIPFAWAAWDDTKPAQTQTVSAGMTSIQGNFDAIEGATAIVAGTNGGSFIFEGATANAHETTLSVTDPTADRTIDFPDASVAQGEMVYGDGAGSLAYLGVGSSGQALTSQGAASNPVWASASTTVALGNFAVDSSASTTSTVSGVGFTPSYVLIFCNEQTTKEASWGFSNSTTDHTVSFAGATTTETFTSNAGVSATLEHSSGNTYDGNIGNFGADGFDVVWTETGTTTGTVKCYWTAFD